MRTSIALWARAVFRAVDVLVNMTLQWDHEKKVIVTLVPDRRQYSVMSSESYSNCMIHCANDPPLYDYLRTYCTYLGNRDLTRVIKKEEWANSLSTRDSFILTIANPSQQYGLCLHAPNFSQSRLTWSSWGLAPAYMCRPNHYEIIRSVNSHRPGFCIGCVHESKPFSQSKSIFNDPTVRVPVWYGRCRTSAKI